MCYIVVHSRAQSTLLSAISKLSAKPRHYFAQQPLKGTKSVVSRGVATPYRKKILTPSLDDPL